MADKVAKRFRDKVTKEEYLKIGAEYHSDNEERKAELRARGFIKSDEEGKGKFDDVLSKNVKDFKAAVTNETAKEDLEEMLKVESEGKNRQSVKDHIESVLSDTGGDE